jgi:hypothetical protein
MEQKKVKIIFGSGTAEAGLHVVVFYEQQIHFDYLQ